MVTSRYQDIQPYITRDRSEIRELMHPTIHGNEHQSLAEARIPPGERTLLHRHHTSEELYHVTAGKGLMQLDEDQFEIQRGDTIAIPPGTPHAVANIGAETLVILCCCSPAYSHDDTELL